LESKSLTIASTAASSSSPSAMTLISVP
jgi:hypothetical protein